MDNIFLETRRLIIRDHIVEDLESHHQLLSDANVMYYLQDIRTNTLEESKKNLFSSMQEIGIEDRVNYFFRIENRDTCEHIGEVGY